MDLARRVLAAMPNDGRPVTARELHAGLGWSERQCRDALARLARDGHVERLYRGAYRQPETGTTTSRPVRPRAAAVAAFTESSEPVWTASRLADATGMAPARAAAMLVGLTHDGVLVRTAPGEYETAPPTAGHGGGGGPKP